MATLPFEMWIKCVHIYSILKINLKERQLPTKLQHNFFFYFWVVTHLLIIIGTHAAKGHNIKKYSLKKPIKCSIFFFDREVVFDTKKANVNNLKQETVTFISENIIVTM